MRLLGVRVGSLSHAGDVAPMAARRALKRAPHASAAPTAPHAADDELPLFDSDAERAS